MQFPKKVKRDVVMSVEITDNSKEVSGAIHQVGQAMADTGAFCKPGSLCNKVIGIHVAAQAAQGKRSQAVQETRLKCGLKQQDVAERTGINVVTLSGYEIGKNEPNMEALVSLADVYGVTLDYLMCRTDS